MAIVALITAGFGWGTTGIFVRLLGAQGLSVYELLFLRLLVTGFALAPFLIRESLKRNLKRKRAWRASLSFGVAMVFYYLGAITAFHTLSLVTAALIIGSSPILAWLAPLVLERRPPRHNELTAGAGVLLGILGLALLISQKAPAPVIGAHESSALEQILGYAGGFVAAFVTVWNARRLQRMGLDGPKPLEITFATVAVTVILSPVLVSNFGRVFAIAGDHILLALGFGVVATAIPGLAIAYASARLPAQATSTVSIQLQVWAGVMAWILLNESMSPLQMTAAALIVAGSALCLKPNRAPHSVARHGEKST